MFYANIVDRCFALTNKAIDIASIVVLQIIALCLLILSPMINQYVCIAYFKSHMLHNCVLKTLVPYTCFCKFIYTVECRSNAVQYCKILHKWLELARMRSEDTPTPHDYPYYRFTLDPKSKRDKVKITNLKNLPKLQIFEFWKKQLCMTHRLKLRDEMCKYKMDPTSIVEDTGQTPFRP